MDTKTFLQKALRGDGRYCLFAARKSDYAEKYYEIVKEIING